MNNYLTKTDRKRATDIVIKAMAEVAIWATTCPFCGRVAIAHQVTPDHTRNCPVMLAVMLAEERQ